MLTMVIYSLIHMAYFPSVDFKLLIDALSCKAIFGPCLISINLKKNMRWNLREQTFFKFSNDRCKLMKFVVL